MIAVKRPRQWFDGVAIAASSLCLVHCLLLPTVLLALPAMALVLRLPQDIHAWAFGCAVSTSSLAILLGYRSHRRRSPGIFAAFGLTLLATGAFVVSGSVSETLVTVLGAVTLAVAHAQNWQAAR